MVDPSVGVLAAAFMRTCQATSYVADKEEGHGLLNFSCFGTLLMRTSVSFFIYYIYYLGCRVLGRAWPCLPFPRYCTCSRVLGSNQVVKVHT